VTTPAWTVAAAIEGAKFEPTGWKERGGKEWQIPEQRMVTAGLYPLRGGEFSSESWR
jgi:hypothetical protein